MTTRLSYKLLEQGFVSERLKSFYGRYGDLIKHYKASLSSPKCYISFWESDILHWSDISRNRNLVNELDLITDFDINITRFKDVFIEHLHWMRLANRGRLLLRTPGPVPFRTFIYSNVDTIMSNLICFRTLNFEHPLVLFFASQFHLWQTFSDDFNYYIAKCAFLSSNISSLAYGVFISQPIRYARVCSVYDVLFCGQRVFNSNKLLEQGYAKECLK